jgi:hypothetical protein
MLEALESRRLLTGTGNEQSAIAPTNVSVTIGYREGPDGATDRAHISWTDNNSIETGYRVEYSPDGVYDWAVIGPDVPANNTTAAQVLDAGQKYYYRVRAMQGAGASAPSNVVTPTTPFDKVVQVSANPVAGGVRLFWPVDSDAVSYTVYRKRRNDSQWTLLTAATLPATATGYYDNIGRGIPYEYKVVRMTHNFYGNTDGPAYGYVYAAKAAPLVESRGRVLLVVDQTKAAALSGRLQQFTRDLIGDGWTVDQLNAARDNGNAHLASTVKNQIQQRYFAAPGGLQSIILIGHVPVPYSGTTNWDGHADHVGAWPSDLYYGESLGTLYTNLPWTDQVRVTNTTFPDNNNDPGDGKFDQNSLVYNVTVPVGRIDFANMPGMGWSFSPTVFDANVLETRLLQRYLDKDHSWRLGDISVEPRALVDDHFGSAHAENGWRNFAPLVGGANTYALDWEANLHDESYLWAYGCAPGTVQSAQNVVGTDVFHDPTNQYQVAFSMLYGSYFGDWNKTGDLMREFIATPGAALTCAWVGTPNWFVHGMGLGETIGQGLVVSANNTGEGPYLPASVGMRGVQMGLMGDPTLTMASVRPVQDLSAARLGSGAVKLTWSAPNDAVVGYYVYRAASANGPFTRLNSTLIPGTNQALEFTDLSGGNLVGGATYMVRAVKLQSTASGSYYNASIGQLVDVAGTTIIQQTQDLAEVHFAPLLVARPIFWTGDAKAEAKHDDALRTVVDEL